MLNRLARPGLGLLGLALMAAPARAQVGSAPAGYQPPAGLDGKPVATAPADASAPHNHKGKTLCARCAAAQDPRMMPPGKIVACAHSRNGVCTACQAALAMPGEIVMMAPPAPAEAPGRAVASSSPAPAGSSAMAARRPSGTVAAPYDGPSGDPTPIGVMQANFAPGAPMGMGMPPMSAMPGASAPGRAVAEAGAGPAPYRPSGRGVTNPHIFGHLLGWSGIGAERSEARMRRKAESHAMIPYNNEGTTINELPASAVYGKR